MKLVVQRVAFSDVKVDGEVVGKIDKGFMVLLGVTHTDTKENADFLAKKLCNLRVFEDENEKMNLSIKDVNGDILSISQFTLYANCIKGRRPGFEQSANKDKALDLYLKFNQVLRDKGMKVEEGIFGADMKIELLNDGPVTIMLDSEVIFNGK